MEPTNTPIPAGETEAFWDYVSRHQHEDPLSLRLKAKGSSGFALSLAITQIEARQKASAKLRQTLADWPRLLFPTPLSAEQCTEEHVARLHGAMVRPGWRVLDLTAGLGMDAISFAQAGAAVLANDLDPLVSQALARNAAMMGLEQLEVASMDATELLASLKGSGQKFDIAYIDPARRSGTSKSGGRTYSLADCTPDVTTMLEAIMEVTPRLCIKASPMVDQEASIRQLEGVKECHTVSYKGECKETMFVVERGHRGEPEMRCILVNPDDTVQEMAFPVSECGKSAERYAESPSDFAGGWLYEPDAAVMKAAPWGWLIRKWPGLYKVAPNSHLFLSHDLIADFPGRKLRIAEVGTKPPAGLTAANVAVRNHPLSADALRRKLRLKESPDASTFLYGTRDQRNRPLLILAHS